MDDEVADVKELTGRLWKVNKDIGWFRDVTMWFRGRFDPDIARDEDRRRKYVQGVGGEGWSQGGLSGMRPSRRK